MGPAPDPDVATLVDPAPALDSGAAWRAPAAARDVLAQRAFDGLAATWPSIAGYTAAQQRHSVDDLGRILDFTAIAQFVADDALLVRSLLWDAGSAGKVRSVPAAVLNAGLAALVEQTAEFPESRRVLAAALDVLDRRSDGVLHAAGGL